MNTNTNTNIYAETIANNRYIAKAQLTADDMGMTAWSQYRQLCDNIAIASWKSLAKKDTGSLLGTSLAGLFEFFGCDAKANAPMQRRIILACVSVKKEQSVAMKKAKKDLREITIELDNANSVENPDAELVATLTEKQNTVKEVVEKLESEPMNVWYNRTPMLDTTRKHASTKCRKLIEDTIADIIAEREFMTVEELQEEALQLKAERKARKQAKAQAQAQANA